MTILVRICSDRHPLQGAMGACVGQYCVIGHECSCCDDDGFVSDLLGSHSCVLERALVLSQWRIYLWIKPSRAFRFLLE